MRAAGRGRGGNRTGEAWCVGNSARIDSSAFPVPPRDSLEISLDAELPAGRGHRELLLGFHFGRSPADPIVPGVVDTGMDPLEHDDLYECWWYDGAVDYRQSGTARIAECDEFAAIVVQVPDAGPADFRDLTRRVYDELLAAVGKTRHRHIVRFWNYFSNINQGEGDAEKYRQFSIGRAEAFEASGLTDEAVPAATAIGSTRDCDFTVIALVSSHEFSNVENPRQVSAYRYPRDYGPRSPKFSRAGCVNLDGQQLLLISGTASIIGHESMHAGDTLMQVEETLNNLRELSEALAEVGHVDADAVLDSDSVVRVYVRDTSSLDYVKQSVENFMASRTAAVAYLHGHVCRRELQIEIDAAKIAGLG